MSQFSIAVTIMHMHENGQMSQRGLDKMDNSSSNERNELKQASKVIWQKTASPTCQSPRLQMDLSDLDPM